MRYIASLFFGGMLLFSALFTPVTARAECALNDADDPLGIDCGAETGLNSEDPRVLIAEILKVALGLLGVVALLIVVYAGVLWLTSAGVDDKITKAKQMLVAAVIGLTIILAAYSLTDFILRNLYEATQQNPYSANPRYP